MIIGLVGKPGSGKGTVSSILQESFLGKTVKTVRFSDPLAEVLDIMHIPKTRHNLQHVAVVLDNGFGQGTLTNAVYQRIINTDADLIILDGIRWPTDYEMFRRLPDSKLIYVNVDQRNRFERVRLRKEKASETGVTFEQFEKEDKALNEIHIEEIGAKADFVVDNNGDLNHLKEQINNIISKIKS